MNINDKFKRYLILCLIVAGIAAAGQFYYYNQHSTDLAIKADQTGEAVPLPVTESIDIGPGLRMEFVLIQPGSFTMGSAVYLGEGDETPEHQVTITEPFYLSKYEVTQEQWAALTGSNSSKFQGDERPADSVSWVDSQRLLTKLHEITGRQFSLPTEAQWEYAARAGTTTPWSFGNSEAVLREYAWFGDNADNTTHPVGQKQPNAWGLYDMYGNVQEWCKDWYAGAYAQDDMSDPQGPNTGDSRVLRGGAWGDDFTMVRSSYRNTAEAEAATPGIGLRVLMELN